MSEHEQLSLQAPVVELLTATSGPCLSLQPVAVLANQLGNTRFSLNREGVGGVTDRSLGLCERGLNQPTTVGM